MPSLYDDISPAPTPTTALRPMRPASGGHAPSPPPSAPPSFSPQPPTAPGRARPVKPTTPERPEVPIPDLERARPHALAVVQQRNKTQRFLQREGVIGDLDDEGLDAFAGSIAMMIGCCHTKSAAFLNKNPGGFGISLSVAPGVNGTTLFPNHLGNNFASWMRPLFENYLSIARSPQTSLRQLELRSLSFSSWQEGAEAFITWLRLIRDQEIPYFPLGPMTPLLDIYCTYSLSFTTDQYFRLSKLIPYFIAAEQGLTSRVTAPTADDTPEKSASNTDAAA